MYYFRSVVKAKQAGNFSRLGAFDAAGIVGTVASYAAAEVSPFGVIDIYDIAAAKLPLDLSDAGGQ
jgi:hypothetical protein